MGTYTNLLQKNITPPQEQPIKNGHTVEIPDDQLNDRTTERAIERTDEPKPKINRVKVRHSFEFYQDQIAELKKMHRAAVLNNEEFSMSAVVRAALDQYLNLNQNDQ